MAGKVILECGKSKNSQAISSVDIRIAQEIIGCSHPVFPVSQKEEVFTYSGDLFSELRGTTLIREMLRQISDVNASVKGSTVGGWTSSPKSGAFYAPPQSDVGIRTDLLDC